MNLRCMFSFITGLSKKKFTAVGESYLPTLDGLQLLKDEWMKL